MHELFQKYTRKVKFYPSSDNFAQALLVMLVTNIMSAHHPQKNFITLSRVDKMISRVQDGFDNFESGGAPHPWPGKDSFWTRSPRSDKVGNYFHAENFTILAGC